MTSTQATRKIDPGRAVLWASAFVIGAMVVLQAGRLPGNPAYASAVSNGRGYTLLTSDSGRGEDAAPDEVIIVIDNAAQVIMVYEADIRAGALIARDGGSLPFLFVKALNR